MPCEAGEVKSKAKKQVQQWISETCISDSISHNFTASIQLTHQCKQSIYFSLKVHPVLQADVTIHLVCTWIQVLARLYPHGGAACGGDQPSQPSHSCPL